MSGLRRIPLYSTWFGIFFGLQKCFGSQEFPTICLKKFVAKEMQNYYPTNDTPSRRKSSKNGVILKAPHGGHIKESLGTHGYMKCRFSAHIKQATALKLKLAKRMSSQNCVEISLNSYERCGKRGLLEVCE